ncbi:MAG: hypothetical protein CSA34_08305 [Desulfobulbus propionicus]|nr:MAG: hypothetical protein CSA34_08305 [Desulfobulbus propionicus]
MRIGLSLCLNLMFVQGRKSTEFGAKNRVSRLPVGSLLSTGLAGMRLNESTDLTSQVEGYRNRFGCLPKTVLADQLVLATTGVF